jgi:hypothetical protein
VTTTMSSPSFMVVALWRNQFFKKKFSPLGLVY